jgi:hypothetical protein
LFSFFLIKNRYDINLIFDNYDNKSNFDLFTRARDEKLEDMMIGGWSRIATETSKRELDEFESKTLKYKEFYIAKRLKVYRGTIKQTTQARALPRTTRQRRSSNKSIYEK